MAVQSLPVEVELAVYCGTTFRREFRWKPDGSPAVDFTAWSATMLIGPSRGYAVKVLDTGNGGITLTSAGQILLSMTPAETAALPAGQQTYVLDLTDAGGFVQRFLRGRITIIKDVEKQS